VTRGTTDINQHVPFLPSIYCLRVTIQILISIIMILSVTIPTRII